MSKFWAKDDGVCTKLAFAIQNEAVYSHFTTECL